MLRLFVLLAIMVFAPQLALAENGGNCDPLTVKFSTTPAPPQTTESIRRSQNLLSNPQSADIVLIGDSIFQGWERFLEQDFPGKKVWDFSVGGDRAQNVLWRLNQLKAPSLPPKAVLMLLGTNNLFDSSVDGCAAFEGVKADIAKVRKIWPTTPIFVLTLPPRGADFLQYNAERNGFNAEVMTLGDHFKNVFPAPVDDVEFTCGQYGKKALDNPNVLACAPELAYRCINYKDDNLHFERPAYTAIREVARRASLKHLKYDIFE